MTARRIYCGAPDDAIGWVALMYDHNPDSLAGPMSYVGRVNLKGNPLSETARETIARMFIAKGAALSEEEIAAVQLGEVLRGEQ